MIQKMINMKKMINMIQKMINMKKMISMIQKMINMKKMISRSIVSLVLNPPSRVAAKQELPGLVVAEDQKGEWQGWQPPVDLQGVHPQALVHAGRVGQDGGEEPM